MNARNLITVAALVACLSLSACGGGGDEEPAAPTQAGEAVCLSLASCPNDNAEEPARNLVPVRGGMHRDFGAPTPDQSNP